MFQFSCHVRWMLSCTTAGTMPSKSTTPTTASKLGQYSSEHPESAVFLECVLKEQVKLF